MLLYKKERQQYHEAVVDNVSPSIIYGAEHLLRLFGSCRRIRVLSSFLLTMALKVLKEVGMENMAEKHHNRIDYSHKYFMTMIACFTALLFLINRAVMLQLVLYSYGAFVL